MYNKKTNTHSIEEYTSTDKNNHWKSLLLYYDFIETYSKNNDKDILEEHFHILLGITLELEKRRNYFLETGNLKELFPTAYFHTTVCKMEQILNGVYLYPIEKIKQISYFYQAYLWNRNQWEENQKNLVEEHWTCHFEKTEKKFPIFNLKKYIGHILATGIEAHIDYDLPRALNFAVKNRHLQNVEENTYIEAIKEEFIKTEEIFRTVTDKTNADIEKAGLCNKIWLDIFSKSYGKFLTKTIINPFTKERIYTDSDVISKRITAWKKAISNQHFIGKNGKKLQEQPQIDVLHLKQKGKMFLEKSMRRPCFAS